MTVSSANFPAAYAAMDAAASEFWAYPDADWQGRFLAEWATATGDADLLLALQ